MIKQQQKGYLNRIILLDSMDIENVPIEKLREIRKKVIHKLGEIEVQINYNKQKIFKMNVIAQGNIIILKDNKKYWSKLKARIDERLARGY